MVRPLWTVSESVRFRSRAWSARILLDPLDKVLKGPRIGGRTEYPTYFYPTGTKVMASGQYRQSDPLTGMKIKNVRSKSRLARVDPPLLLF